jgi:ribosomal protein S27AE
MPYTPAPEQRAAPKLLSLRQSMAANPRRSECSICGTDVENVPKDAVAVTCWDCTQRLADAATRAQVDYRTQTADGRTCSDCGTPIGHAPNRQTRCGKCQANHRKTALRDAQRRKRSATSPTVNS